MSDSIYIRSSSFLVLNTYLLPNVFPHLYVVIGLDPALPFFATFKDEWKLDPSDAVFVDVIHTSAGVFGKIEALGHVDFYVNGGTLQPSCNNAKSK